MISEYVAERRTAGSFFKETDIEIEFETKLKNSIETNWSQISSIAVSQEIGFSVKIFSSTTRLEFTQEWQKGGSKTEEVDITDGVRIPITLAADERRTFSNIALQGTATIEITYSASLEGGFFSTTQIHMQYQVCRTSINFTIALSVMSWLIEASRIT